MSFCLVSLLSLQDLPSLYFPRVISTIKSPTESQNSGNWAVGKGDHQGSHHRRPGQSCYQDHSATSGPKGFLGQKQFLCVCFTRITAFPQLPRKYVISTVTSSIKCQVQVQTGLKLYVPPLPSSLVFKAIPLRCGTPRECLFLLLQRS